MKHIPFAIMEGEELPDGRILEKGSLYIDDSERDRIAVTWAHDGHTLSPIGWAHDFQRIDHGDHADLSMVIIMNDDGLQEALEHFRIYPFCTDVEEEVWETVPKILKRVTKARIRTLQLVPIPGIPMGMAREVDNHG